MRRIVLLSLFVLLVGDAGAQRRGGFAPAAGRGGFRPALGRVGSSFNRGRVAYAGGYGYGYLPYDGDESFGYSPQPILWCPPPPPPVHGATSRFRHALSSTTISGRYAGASAPSAEEPQSFGIVLKDAARLSRPRA